MCGRYLISTEDETIEMREIINSVYERYKDSPEIASFKTGEIFPTNTAPVLVQGKSSFDAVLMKWGYPKWDKKGVVINARSETVEKSRFFNKSLFSGRCIIPASGFFEWRQKGEKKQKYLFTPETSGVLYMAGLCGTFANDTGKNYTAFVILTTAANRHTVAYHDRMPLILQGGMLDNWLYNTDFALDLIKKPCGFAVEALAV